MRPNGRPLFFTLVCGGLSGGSTREGIIQGHLDYDLTPIGVNQAEVTANRLRGHTYWQTHSSDLRRAYRTAEIILEEHPGSTLVKTPLLREFGLGAQEGLPRGTTWCV